MITSRRRLARASQWSPGVVSQMPPIARMKSSTVTSLPNHPRPSIDVLENADRVDDERVAGANRFTRRVDGLTHRSCEVGLGHGEPGEARHPLAQGLVGVVPVEQVSRAVNESAVLAVVHRQGVASRSGKLR